MNFHQRIDKAEGWNKPNDMAAQKAQVPLNATNEDEDDRKYGAPLVGDNDPRFDDPKYQAWLDRTLGRISPPIEAIDDAVNPRLTKECKIAVATVTHISPKTFAAIGLWSLFTPTIQHELPDLRGKLAELQKEYEAVIKTGLDYTQRKAGEAFWAYQSECEKTTAETGSVAHALGKTREQFELEYAHKSKLAFQAAKAFAPRARELLQPHIRRYVAMVRELADKEAAKEQRLYSFVCLPWKVSTLVATLYRAAELIESHNGAGYDPKSVAQFLDLNAEPSEKLSFEEEPNL